MVTVIKSDRRSAVLTSSSIACLKHMPTINLTSGCAHGCIYCYTRSYSSYPGENRVILYGNTIEKLKLELAHKRTKPQAVYFSPSSDLFQPLPEVLALGYRVLEFLFSQSIGVAFLSKGCIPEQTMSLFFSYPDKVRAQIGIITLDDDIQHMFEPNAVSPNIRLEQMARLIAGGISTEARLDPILPGLTDPPGSLSRLFSNLAKVGVKRVAASTLFLRPSVRRSLERNVSDKDVLQRLLWFYRDAKRMAIHAERSSVVALPRSIREAIYVRIKRAAEEHGMVLSICACKNPDLAHDTCNIGGTWLKPFDSQKSLFGDGG